MSRAVPSVNGPEDHGVNETRGSVMYIVESPMPRFPY